MTQPSESIRKRLDRFVGLKLYTDKVPGIMETQDAERLLNRNVELQKKLFGSVAQPSYAIVTPDGKSVLSSYVGLEQKAGDFARFLDDGMKKWEAAGTAIVNRN